MPERVSPNAITSASAVAAKETRRRTLLAILGSGVGSGTVISVVLRCHVLVRSGAFASGKRHLDGEPARRPRAERHRAAVRLGDGAHDREPEARAVAARTA